MNKKLLIAIIIFMSIVLLVGGFALYLKLTEKKEVSIYDQGLIWSYGSDDESSSDLASDYQSQSDIYNEGENNDGNGGAATSAAVKPEDPSNPLLEDFTIYDRSQAEVKAMSFKGKPTIIMFWASWCDICKSPMDMMEEIYKNYGKAVNIVMIDYTDNSRETVELAEKFISDGAYTFPYYFDKDGSAVKACNVTSMPTTYFVDRYCRVKSFKVGMIVEDDLKKGIQSIIE